MSGAATSKLTHNGTRWRNGLALLLGAAGSLQMVGDLTGLKAIKGLGAATVASPLPKVFSDVRGLETFASDFSLSFQLLDGNPRELSITPELYQRLAGPYNRRNVYGAALAYAPRLPQPLWETVFCSGLKPGGPLRREFGVPDDATNLSVLITTRTQGRHDTWRLQPSCTR